MFLFFQETIVFIGHLLPGELLVLVPGDSSKKTQPQNETSGRPVSRNLSSNRDTISKSPKQRGDRLSQPTSVKIVMLYSAMK